MGQLTLSFTSSSYDWKFVKFHFNPKHSHWTIWTFTRTLIYPAYQMSMCGMQLYGNMHIYYLVSHKKNYANWPDLTFSSLQNLYVYQCLQNMLDKTLHRHVKTFMYGMHINLWFGGTSILYSTPLGDTRMQNQLWKNEQRKIMLEMWLQNLIQLDTWHWLRRFTLPRLLIISIFNRHGGY